jgi:nitroreductase
MQTEPLPPQIDRFVREATAEMSAAQAASIIGCGEASVRRLCENKEIAAHELGLGAVWIGVYPLEERVAAVRAELGVPEGVVPFAMVALGHPATQKGPVDRYDAARIHRERW